jgi:malonate transporter MadL subunit
MTRSREAPLLRLYPFVALQNRAIASYFNTLPLNLMPLYGTALLAVCHLLGILLGELLGNAIGVHANVGGVGIAMLLLIAARLYGHHRGLLEAKTEEGVNYWAALYIPVVIAMAMQQNVVKALSGGSMALSAAALTVAGGIACVALINRNEPQDKTDR